MAATNDILPYLQHGMEEYIGKVFDEAVEQATKDAQAKRDEFIAAQMLKLTRYMDMQTMNDRIILTIEKPKGDY